MPSNRIKTLTLATVLSVGASAHAATTLKFTVTHGDPNKSTTQAAYIKDGKVLIKSAGGDPRYDLLFIRKSASMRVIDHGDRTVLTFDKQQITDLAARAQGMMTTVQQQIETNLAQLPPGQAERMRNMLGGMGIPVTAPAPVPEKKIVPAGTKTVNAIRCRQIEVLRDRRKVAEFCVADAPDLNLPTDDYATVLALQAFGKTLAEKTEYMSRHVGGVMPNIGFEDVDGIPVEMRDLTGPVPSSMTVTGILAGIGGVVFTIPNGYTPRSLPSLPQLNR